MPTTGANDALAAAGRKQQFGHMRGHRNDAPSRLLQRDRIAVVVQHADGGVGLERDQAGAKCGQKGNS
jgi:hypothetical protein